MICTHSDAKLAMALRSSYYSGVSGSSSVSAGSLKLAPEVDGFAGSVVVWLGSLLLASLVVLACSLSL